MSTEDFGAPAPSRSDADEVTGPYAGTGSGGGGGSDGGGVKEQTQAAAETAKEEARHVADVAKGEAQSVTADARIQASQLLDDARVQLEEQSSTQLDRLVGLLREFGDDLDRMVRGEPSEGGPARDLVGEVADKARVLRSQLEGRQPAELLDQVRDFARRRPGTFLLGSLAAGVVAGRLTRGVKQAHGDDQHTPDSAAATRSAGAGRPDYPGGAGTASGAPLAGTGTPVAGTGPSSEPLAAGATPPASTPPPVADIDPAGEAL